jgi:hypothetical protein
MIWASLPDPKGISRVTLNWTASSTAQGYAVYEADETSLSRELSLNSPDLELAAADRLVALRPLLFSSARRAFARVADNVSTPSLAVALPRGSRLIHFYAIAAISSTGVESPLPAAGNDYLAVAAGTTQIPEPPVVIARDRNGVVTLQVDVSEMRVRVGRVELFRSTDAQRAILPEHAGPPIAVLDASTSGTRVEGSIRFEFDDTSPGKAWQCSYYRALAWAESQPDRGVYGGRSPSSRSVEVVVTSTVPPTLAALALELDPAFPDHRLLSFDTDASLQETPQGGHLFAVHVLLIDGTLVTRRTRGNALPIISGAMPGPVEQADSIFRHAATNPIAGRTFAWVPHDMTAVIVEITNPAGRTIRAEILPP